METVSQLSQELTLLDVNKHEFVNLGHRRILLHRLEVDSYYTATTIQWLSSLYIFLLLVRLYFKECRKCNILSVSACIYCLVWITVKAGSEEFVFWEIGATAEHRMGNLSQNGFFCQF